MCCFFEVHIALVRYVLIFRNPDFCFSPISYPPHHPLSHRYRALWDVYRLEADDAYYTALRDVVEGELFRLPLPAFRRREAVRTTAQALGVPAGPPSHARLHLQG